MKFKHIVLTLFIIFFINNVCAETNTIEVGNDIVQPRTDQGNLVIYNEGYISYNIFVENGNYTGTIKHNQGIYLNETLNYNMYASYDEWRSLANLDIVEEKFNQWWIVIIVGIIILIGLFEIIYIIRGKKL